MERASTRVEVRVEGAIAIMCKEGRELVSNKEDDDGDPS